VISSSYKRYEKRSTAVSISRALVRRVGVARGTESEIEIRQVFEASDFGAELTPELREQEERLRAQVAAKQ
jgi:hypothetical protein